MIDSLLQMDELEEKSQLAARLTFNSNVAAAGRTFNINQFGLSSGLSYYHKTGAYLDLAGYWSNAFEPQQYYLTMFTGGYLFFPSSKWSILAEYSKYLYSESSGDEIANIPYTNSLGLSNLVNIKSMMFRLDYYFYFGKRPANRILPGISLKLEKKNWLNIDRILIYPSFNMLIGNETIIEDLPKSILAQIIRERNGLPPTYESEKNEFGVMNYSLSIPASIQTGNWNFFVSYVYNIPVALPGEVLPVENSGFLSAGITKYFDFK